MAARSPEITTHMRLTTEQYERLLREYPEVKSALIAFEEKLSKEAATIKKFENELSKEAQTSQDQNRSVPSSQSTNPSSTGRFSFLSNLLERVHPLSPSLNIPPQPAPNTILQPAFVHVLVWGDAGVGKTSLLKQISDDGKMKKIEVHGQTVNLHFRERNDKDRYQNIGYMNSQHVIILCYDICIRDGFENIMNYKKDIEAIVPQAKIILVANKSDLSEKWRMVSTQEGQIWQSKLKMDRYFETSAETRQGCEEVVRAAAELGLQAKAELSNGSVPSSQFGFGLK